MRTSGKRGLVAVALILLSTWAIAGVINANASLMGAKPTTVGSVATLVAMCAWPLAGWFAGSLPGTGFLRLTTAFWVTVLLGTPLAVLGWVVLTDRSHLAGRAGLLLVPIGLLLYFLMFAFTAPLYGVYALLPVWERISYSDLIWAAVLGLAVFGLALGAYLVGRWVSGLTTRTSKV